MAARLAFIAEWLDPNSGVLWRYQLFYYPATGEIEMFDIKNKRHFLKRVKYESITQQQLYVGSTVVVYSRQMRLVDYGDEATQLATAGRSERTLALIKPDAVKHTGKIITAIITSGFNIVNLRMCQLSKSDAESFYAIHSGKHFFQGLTSYMCSAPIVAMELMAANGISKWRQLLGPTDSKTAQQQAPDSIRAMYGTDGTRNAAHGSDSPASAAAELAFFFAPRGSNANRSTPTTHCSSSNSSNGGGGAAGGAKNSARCQQTTLGIIKPHAVKDGLAGLLLDSIQDVFQVTGLQMFNLSKAAAAEFLEVYKGVVAPGEFSGLVEELVAGPCMAIEVADRDGGSGDPVEPFRQLCGPLDPELGRVLRPQSLRARFGINRVKNAVHCTDLPEDGQLETNFFFNILAQ